MDEFFNKEISSKEKFKPFNVISYQTPSLSTPFYTWRNPSTLVESMLLLVGISSPYYFPKVINFKSLSLNAVSRAVFYLKISDLIKSGWKGQNPGFKLALTGNTS